MSVALTMLSLRNNAHGGAMHPAELLAMLHMLASPSNV